MSTILVVCAHSDDQIIGAGGTLAKYAREGHTVKTLIMSYGETGNFWLKEHLTVKMRVSESEHADNVIKGKGVTFFDLKEGKFDVEAQEKNVVGRLANRFRQEHPHKVFTHSKDDPLKDHRDTLKLVLEAMDRAQLEVPVYSFNVWNLFNLKRERPKLIVDISTTFPTKLKALKCFKSQTLAMISLLWSVYAKAFLYGIQNHTKWAEVFHKVR